MQYLDLGKHLPVLSLAQVSSEDRQMSSVRSGCARTPGHHTYLHITAFLVEVTAATDLPLTSCENILMCLKQHPPGYLSTVSQLFELAADFPPKAGE